MQATTSARVESFHAPDGGPLALFGAEHFAEGAKFGSASLSPCRKNSSIERRAHAVAIGCGLAGLEMSAACRSTFIRICLSSALLDLRRQGAL